jgi:hypothetical protein
MACGAAQRKLTMTNTQLGSTQSNVHDIIQESIETARFICEEHFDIYRSPPVQLVCPPDLHFAYASEAF